MSESSSAPAPLATQGLWHTYEERSALRGVDFSVDAGSVLGLIGRNGAGNSTLIRALLGLLVPSSGCALPHAEPRTRSTARKGQGRSSAVRNSAMSGRGGTNPL